MKKLIAFFLPLLFIKCLNAQPEKFDNILYGVAYYHEYMPYERLDMDILRKVTVSCSSHGIFSLLKNKRKLGNNDFRLVLILIALFIQN